MLKKVDLTYNKKQLQISRLVFKAIFRMSEHLEATLDQEIQKRINHESPTKYDMDFYSRKISRLENDNNQMHEELSKLRLRLRRAEDFQLKYELVLKQLSSLQADLDVKDKQLAQARSNLQQYQLKIQEKETKSTDWQSRLMEIQNELNRWKERAEEAEQSKMQIIMDLKDKQAKEVKRQIEMSRREFNDKEQEYQFEIRSLRKIVDEKHSVQTVVKNRVEKVRSEKDEQIFRLRGNMESLKQECKEALREKNEQLDQMREKFEKMFNFELQNLHKNQQEQDQLFSIQLNGLRQLIGIKNDEIQRLLSQVKALNQEWDKERQEAKEQIIILKESIYRIQRENELELYNLKDRLASIHTKDLKNTQQRFENIIEALRREREELEGFIKEKDRILDSEHRQLERIKAEYIDRLKEREARIEQLTERIRRGEQMNQKEMKDLHQSFHKIESQKQIMSSEYQANVGFLNNQLAKQTAINDNKNQQIKKLHEEISRIKKQYNEIILDVEARWKEQRRQWQQARDDDRKKFEELEEKLRLREREWKAKEKHFNREIDKRDREINKLEFINKEMETDTDRLNQYIKQLDDSLKREYKKNQMSTLDNAGVRRELTAELDRQKNQLEAIMRMEIDQSKKKLENEMTRLRNENQRLQTQLVKRSIANQNLEEELKRLQALNKNSEVLNKERLIEYQKKMATLNQEITLTQNLYKTFMETKAKKTY